MITMKIAGFVELERNLRRLPMEVAGRVLARALRVAGQPMAEDAAARARRSQQPSRIGHMADSIKLRSFKTESDNDVEVNLWLGPDPDHFYGMFPEFGTIHEPARPFLRPAWDRHKEATLARFGTELGAAIERAAKRLHRQ